MANRRQHSGRCVMFNDVKGFGFITLNDGTRDIFVHRSNIRSTGYCSLTKGQMVKFEILIQKDGRRKAVNVITDTLPKMAHNYGQRRNIQQNSSQNNTTHYPHAPRRAVQSYSNSENNYNHSGNDDTAQIHLSPYQWVWQNDDTEWYAFDKNIDIQIEKCYVGSSILFEIGKWKYKIYKQSANTASQQNLSTNNVRSVKRINTKINVDVERKQNDAVIKQLTLKKILHFGGFGVPNWWNKTEMNNNHLVEWSMHSSVCNQIRDAFKRGLNNFNDFTVVSISSVQNKSLWKLYQSHRSVYKETIGFKQLNENFLWHGTNFAAANSICTQGFLRDYGKNMKYGKGVYYAKYSQYSASTAYSAPDADGYQYMFLCRALLGESCVGNSTYIVPPTKANSAVHYESMVDDLAQPSIFVISKDNQVYPAFLIKFVSQQQILMQQHKKQQQLNVERQQKALMEERKQQKALREAQRRMEQKRKQQRLIEETIRQQREQQEREKIYEQQLIMGQVQKKKQTALMQIRNEQNRQRLIDEKVRRQREAAQRQRNLYHAQQLRVEVIMEPKQQRIAEKIRQEQEDKKEAQRQQRLIDEEEQRQHQEFQYYALKFQREDDNKSKESIKPEKGCIIQ